MHHAGNFVTAKYTTKYIKYTNNCPLNQSLLDIGKQIESTLTLTL
jgi:hypothetical protein